MINSIEIYVDDEEILLYDGISLQKFYVPVHFGESRSSEMTRRNSPNTLVDNVFDSKIWWALCATITLLTYVLNTDDDSKLEIIINSSSEYANRMFNKYCLKNNIEYNEYIDNNIYTPHIKKPTDPHEEYIDSKFFDPNHSHTSIHSQLIPEIMDAQQIISYLNTKGKTIRIPNYSKQDIYEFKKQHENKLVKTSILDNFELHIRKYFNHESASLYEK